MLGGTYLGQAYLGSAGAAAPFPVGRSLALPYTVTGQTGKSLVVPYAVRALAGRSLVTSYTVIAFVGKSLVLPAKVLTLLGKSLAQLWTIAAPSALAGKENADTYSDGASDPYGSAVPLPLDLSVYATYVSLPWSPPAGLDEEQYARLPFPLAQDLFGAVGVLAGTARVGRCGWHGTRFDPAVGAFALVASGGPLADLVGRRVRVRLNEGVRMRAVYVYVRDQMPLDEGEDISLPRREFMALGSLGRTSLPVTVELVPKQEAA